VHIQKIIDSDVVIHSSVENVWDQLTNVEIEHFRFPWYFRLLHIPKPIRAEITKEGVGGNRVAYFDNGKKFFQEISTWEKYTTYSFTFHPEDDFKAGYFFNVFNGVFKIVRGTYVLTPSDNGVKVTLKTDYSIQKNVSWLLRWPVWLILIVFQKYLLNTIKVNSEREVNH
jgi:hypothetical protein